MRSSLTTRPCLPRQPPQLHGSPAQRTAPPRTRARSSCAASRRASRLASSCRRSSRLSSAHAAPRRTASSYCWCTADRTGRYAAPKPRMKAPNTCARKVGQGRRAAAAGRANGRAHALAKGQHACDCALFDLMRSACHIAWPGIRAGPRPACSSRDSPNADAAARAPAHTASDPPCCAPAASGLLRPAGRARAAARSSPAARWRRPRRAAVPPKRPAAAADAARPRAAGRSRSSLQAAASCALFALLCTRYNRRPSFVIHSEGLTVPDSSLARAGFNSVLRVDQFIVLLVDQFIVSLTVRAACLPPVSRRRGRT